MKISQMRSSKIAGERFVHLNILPVLNKDRDKNREKKEISAVKVHSCNPREKRDIWKFDTFLSTDFSLSEKDKCTHGVFFSELTYYVT